MDRSRRFWSSREAGHPSSGPGRSWARRRDDCSWVSRTTGCSLSCRRDRCSWVSRDTRRFFSCLCSWSSRESGCSLACWDDHGSWSSREYWCSLYCWTSRMRGNRPHRSLQEAKQSIYALNLSILQIYLCRRRRSPSHVPAPQPNALNPF